MLDRSTPWSWSKRALVKGVSAAGPNDLVKSGVFGTLNGSNFTGVSSVGMALNFGIHSFAPTKIVYITRYQTFEFEKVCNSF